MRNPFEGYRVIDLSMPIYPGVMKQDNSYFWGQHERQFELRCSQTPMYSLNVWTN